jgi:hypothetical protein
VFIAVMLDAVIENANEIFDTLRPSDDLRRTLERFGASFLALSLSEQSLSVRRNSIAEGSRSGIGDRLYERGAKVLWSRMADFLQGEMLAGRLRTEDPWMVGMHLRGMLEADLVNRALIGAAVDARPKKLRDHATKAVDALMRAYDPQSEFSDTMDTPPSTGKVAPTT